jgi:hypothetical protein
MMPIISVDPHPAVGRSEEARSFGPDLRLDTVDPKDALTAEARAHPRRVNLDNRQRLDIRVGSTIG